MCIVCVSLHETTRVPVRVDANSKCEATARRYASRFLLYCYLRDYYCVSTAVLILLTLLPYNYVLEKCDEFQRRRRAITGSTLRWNCAKATKTDAYSFKLKLK